MKSYKSSSTMRPQEWDKTSSPGCVYHNYNITETEADADNPLMYHYDVDEYDRLEYLEMQNAELLEQNRMLTDCLLEMSEVVYA